MRIFRRSESEKDEEPKAEIVRSEIVRKLDKEWNDKSARYIYVLRAGEKYFWSDGYSSLNQFWRQLQATNDKGWVIEAQGDLDWAKRIAEHYKIELPKEVV